MNCRTRFLQPLLLLAAAFIAGSQALAAPLFPEAPGMCSYTYREQFKKDVPGTLDAIKALGIRDMEFSNQFGKTAKELRQLLDARGMVCSPYGVGYDDLMKKTDEVAGNAKELATLRTKAPASPRRCPRPFSISRASPSS